MDADTLRSRHIRNFNETELTREERAPLYDTLCARLLRDTAAKKLGMSVDILAPGKVGCPYHAHHAQEELFIILEGEGTLRMAGRRLPIRAGDVITVPAGPELPHQIVNTSSAPLKYLSISTREQPELVEYPDSQKYLVRAVRDGEASGFSAIHRAKDDLDYWDGEP